MDSFKENSQLRSALLHMNTQYWQNRFNYWAQSPSQTEQDKADRAERMAKDAIKSYAPLATRDIFSRTILSSDRIFTYPGWELADDLEYELDQIAESARHASLVIRPLVEERVDS